MQSRFEQDVMYTEVGKYVQLVLCSMYTRSKDIDALSERPMAVLEMKSTSHVS